MLEKMHEQDTSVKVSFRSQAQGPGSPTTLTPVSGMPTGQFLLRACSSLQVPRYCPGFNLPLGLIPIAIVRGSFIHSQAPLNLLALVPRYSCGQNAVPAFRKLPVQCGLVL